MTKTVMLSLALLLVAGCNMSRKDQRAAEKQCEDAGGYGVALAHLWSPDKAAYVVCERGALDGKRFD